MIDEPPPIALPDPANRDQLICGFTAREWGDKIEADLKHRRVITRAAHDLIRRYTGEAKTLTNFEFELVSVVTPSLAYTLPKCRVTDGGAQDEQTEDTTVGLNCLIAQNGLAEQTQLLAIDQAFSFAVAMVLLEETPGLLANVDLVPLRPVVRRISPNMYFRDCESVGFSRVRHEGHLWVEKIQALEGATNADGSRKYDNTQLTGLQPGTLDSQVRADLMLDGVSVDADERDRIVCATVYVADEDVLLTFAMADTEPRLLRKVKAQCAGQSPYTLFSIYAAPDRVYPVAPLQATAAWLEVHEKMTKSIIEQAIQAKTLAFVDSQQPGISEVTKNAPHAAIVGIPGLSGKPVMVEFPGVNADHMAVTKYASDQADRRVGISEQARGITTSGTATDAAIAGQFTDIKTKYQQMMFTRGLSLVLGKVVNLMNESDDVIFPVSKDGRRATFYGGVEDDQRDAERIWRRDATIEIEPFSMAYTNSSTLRQQMIEFITLAMDVADRSLANPAIQAGEIIGDMGQHFNIAKAAERYINVAMAGMPGMTPGMLAGMPGVAADPARAPGGQANPSRMVPANL